MKEKKEGIYRWICLGLGTVAMVCCGVSYAWAILKAPLADAFGWSPAELALNHTLSMVFIMIGNLGAGGLARKVSCRLLIGGSGVLMFLGFCIASTMNEIGRAHV